jgi:hypothetical protein
LTDLIPEAFSSGINSMNQHFIFLQQNYFSKNNEWVFINHNFVTYLDVALTDLIPEAFGSGINSMRQHFIFLQQ